MANEKILVIDDEDDIRTILEMSLASVGGFLVLQAPGGQEGIELAAKERPDLILLDAMMPGMDGPSTLKQIQETPALKGIPVIFLTAKAQTSELDRLKSLGAKGVMTKPFDPMTLPNEVRKFLTKGGDS